MILLRHPVNLGYQSVDTERRKKVAPESNREVRDSFEKDYGRIIHSAAFRRLKSKTQVFATDAGDFHRTRLTHSMEVAQISRGIVVYLNENSPIFQDDFLIDVSLLEAASLAHDLGHPPFGHMGEEALHDIMKNFGGFEGNAQTFRLLTRLVGEKEYGLNLTRGLLLTVMKYPIILEDALNIQEAKPPKANAFDCDEEVFRWVLEGLSSKDQAFLTMQTKGDNQSIKTVNKSLECSILELADDIAYATHDLEDAVTLGYISIEKLVGLFRSWYEREDYPELNEAILDLERAVIREEDWSLSLQKLISRVISTLIFGIEVVEQPVSLDSPRIRYTVNLKTDLRALLDRLTHVIRKEVLESQEIQTLAYRGKRVIKELFEAFYAEPKLLPLSERQEFLSVPNMRQQMRVICDYVASMTDLHAERLYQQLFGLRQKTLYY